MGNLFLEYDINNEDEDIEYLKNYIKTLEEKIKILEEKNEESKNYKKQYFQNNTKHKFRYCDKCEKDILFNSYFNHLKSKKHLEKIKNI